MGRPVITTQVGIEGIGATHGKEVLVSDSPEEWAELLTMLPRHGVVINTARGDIIDQEALLGQTVLVSNAARDGRLRYPFVATISLRNRQQ